MNFSQRPAESEISLIKNLQIEHKSPNGLGEGRRIPVTPESEAWGEGPRGERGP